MVAAATGGAIPGWFWALFVPLLVLGVVFGVAMLRREGWEGAARIMSGRGSYRPRASIAVGMTGIVLAAILGRFWIAAIVVVVVILYTWWRYWRAAPTRRPKV
jgi:UPF0716 family protein affecting phage T7 exclusion